MPDGRAVFGVCGWSGSGKTTLIEGLVPRLCARGLTVAVVKHDVHRIDVDHPGKDSDRMFRSGADVFLRGNTEGLVHVHGVGDEELEPVLARLGRRYDLLLVEGYKHTPGPKVWLESDDGRPMPDVEGVMRVLPRDVDRVDAVASILDGWLRAEWVRTPVYGCVLIGGKSRRMGRPKHLLRTHGETWLERTIGLLDGVSERVVIAGAGDLPATVAGAVVRLPDVPDAKGPVAGILAATRWAPHASWLVAACDLPELNSEALAWLLSTRAPGVWATLPRLPGSPGFEPLLAHYDFRSGDLLESWAARGEFCPARITSSLKVISPAPPENLATAWRNVNAADECGGLADLDASAAEGRKDMGGVRAE